MADALVAYSPCFDCKNKPCSLCELNMYRQGILRQEKWISVEERLPTEEENDRGLVGIVNGHNGKIGFHDAIIFVEYDFEEKEWWSQDYNLIGCTVEFWAPLPEPLKMKGGE